MRVSRVNRSRISDIVVSRNTVVNSVSGVDRAPSVFAVENNTAENSSNFLLSKEAFYDNMERMNKEQEDYLAKLAEEELRKRQNNWVSSSEDDVVAFIHETIDKFNSAIEYVKKVDVAKKQNGLEKILHTVTAHNRPLSNLGILVNREHHMQLNQDKFLTTVSKSPHHLKLLLDPEKGILRKIHDSFMEVLS